jgi:L-threonylcarbamoyladenylate synthase
MTAHPNVKRPSKEAIQDAADSLKKGELVSFPTETVYGLGADATNDAAVARIFEAKGRPSFNPLIVHVPNIQTAKELVHFGPMAEILAAAFWPGPLTLVLPRRENCTISKLASAGLQTLAVRVPKNDLARDLLEACGCPVAAPSANPSGKISPSEAHHVADGLGDKVSIILDGGPCRVGVESTVVSVNDNKVTLLRPGGLSQEDLEIVAGKVILAAPDSVISSPGMLLSHYAPGCPLRMNADNCRNGEAFIGFGPGYENIETTNLSPSGNLVEATANLFSVLHMLDTAEYTSIAVASIPNTDLGVAINDRLKRAAAPRT